MLNSILSQQFWAMEANYLKRFLENVQSKSYSDVIEIEARSTKFNKSTSSIKPYKIDDNIAVIDVKGPLMKRVPWVLSFLFGIQSMESIGNAFNAALSDKKIDAIFLHVDSPGSEVDGVQTLSDTIFKGRNKKSILSFIDGSGTSGAYWIASSADEIILSDETSRVGSIGIIGTHMELSEAAKKAGVGIYVFSAGRFKKIGNEFEKLSESDIKYIDNQFTYLHNIFIDGISKNLGIPKNKLPKDAKEAKIFLGQQGIDAGLADAIMNRDAAMAKLKSMIGSRGYTSYSKSKTSANTETKGESMKYKSYTLIDFVRTIQGCDSLDALTQMEEIMIKEAKRREANASNWIETQDVENLQTSISKLVGERRRQIQAMPEFQKRQFEYSLGKQVGSSQ